MASEILTSGEVRDAVVDRSTIRVLVVSTPNGANGPGLVIDRLMTGLGCDRRSLSRRCPSSSRVRISLHSTTRGTLPKACSVPYSTLPTDPASRTIRVGRSCDR